MQGKYVLIFAVSGIIACLAIYQIFLCAIINSEISASSGFLFFNYRFWFWTAVAWVSAYSIIKNYLGMRRDSVEIISIVAAESAQ